MRYTQLCDTSPFARALISVVEDQAKAQERERLRSLFTDMALSLHWSHDMLVAILSWLTDPEPSDD